MHYQRTGRGGIRGRGFLLNIKTSCYRYQERARAFLADGSRPHKGCKNEGLRLQEA